MNHTLLVALKFMTLSDLAEVSPKKTEAVHALVVLTNTPKFADAQGIERSTPENFERRVFK